MEAKVAPDTSGHARPPGATVAVTPADGGIDSQVDDDEEVADEEVGDEWPLSGVPLSQADTKTTHDTDTAATHHRLFTNPV